MSCYHCKARKAPHDIRGVPCCRECYLIALEHCADWSFEIDQEKLPIPKTPMGMSINRVMNFLSMINIQKWKSLEKAKEEARVARETAQAGEVER